MPWEAHALACQSEQTRVCIARIGVVLGNESGMLKKVKPVFKLGLGGRLGDGQQPFSWIHIDDMTQMLIWLLTDETKQGCYNAAAPVPSTNAEFTQVMAQTLKRPTFFMYQLCAQTIARRAFRNDARRRSHRATKSTERRL